MWSDWGCIRPAWLGGELLALALALVLVWGVRLRRARLRLLAEAGGLGADSGLAEGGRRWLVPALVVAGLSLALLAAAGPYWGRASHHLEASGVNVACVVDLSASMDARDYKPSRLEVASLELGRLLQYLRGQRVAIVGFAGIPQTLLPLTVDYTAAQMVLDNLSSGSIPVPGTVIGDGVRVALERLGHEGGVIVLLSDGEDFHSEPLEAAREAAKRGVPIVAVGIGTESGEVVPEKNGEKEGQLHDDKGQVVHSRLNPKTLQDMAALTGGCYLHLEAGNESNLLAIMEVVHRCQASKQASLEAKTLRDIYQLCLGLGMLLLLAGLMCAALPRSGAARRGMEA